jgi:phosphoribosylglycinamide formyltransferase-1
MSPTPLAIAVLISGTGSNLKALIDASNAGHLNIQIRMVISNREDAPGLQHARNSDIPYQVINAANSPDQDKEITASLLSCGAELVVLAGYMRIIGKLPVDTFSGRMINLHPSLLPRFPGLNTYQRVLDAGDTEHGASIHFVSSKLDAGPLISQVHIPVLSGDQASSLAKRLAPREHCLMVATVELFVDRRVNMVATGVQLDGLHIDQALELNCGNTFEKIS